jgi:hypothetical protein
MVEAMALDIVVRHNVQLSDVFLTDNVHSD